MSARRIIFDAWRKSRNCSISPIRCLRGGVAGTVEAQGRGEIVGQIYAFKDKSDRELALRPEMTPPARMITARRNALTLPLKWFTIAQCFRYERMSRGRKREHYQWNLDIVGADTIQAEAEVIACAAEALRILGLGAQDIAIHLNSRALLSELLAGAGVPPDCHAATFLALDKRGKLDDAAINQLLSESGLDAAAIAAVWKVMGIGTLEEADTLLGSASRRGRFAGITEIADNYGLRNAHRHRRHSRSGILHRRASKHSTVNANSTPSSGADAMTAC